MKITGIEIKNIKSFKTIPFIEFSDSINIFIGKNNTGKSTIIQGIYQLQKHSLGFSDITIGEQTGIIDLYFSGKHQFLNVPAEARKIRFAAREGTLNFLNNTEGYLGNAPKFPEREPDNLIYPFFAKRKVPDLNYTINEENATIITGDYKNLIPKLDRIGNTQFQGNKEYVKACLEILEIEISTIAKGLGKQAVYYINNYEQIPISSMGEGIISIISLIIDLCGAKDKIFLIEEIENDLHPKALKGLLKLIIDKSEFNQFFISTHSNIVMKYLGSQKGSNIYKTELVLDNSSNSDRSKMYTSSIKKVKDDPAERKLILEELGYDLFDLDLWKGYLFLEESSAERIIKDYLIPWFAPSLIGRLRTVSASGISNAEMQFENFNKLFVFVHLESTYKNRAWVILDDGKDEKEVIQKLKEKYGPSGWKDERFLQFEKHNFEEYYPDKFKEKVIKINEIGKKGDRRKPKKELLEEVIIWAKDNDELAKASFENSAKDVIKILREIEIHLQ